LVQAIGLLEPSTSEIVAPGSAWPEIELSLLSIGLIVGTAGLIVSRDEEDEDEEGVEDWDEELLETEELEFTLEEDELTKELLEFDDELELLLSDDELDEEETSELELLEISELELELDTSLEELFTCELEVADELASDELELPFELPTDEVELELSEVEDEIELEDKELLTSLELEEETSELDELSLELEELLTLEELEDELELGVNGTGTEFPASSVIVAGPVGAGSFELIRVQVTFPVAVACEGLQIVPGKVIVAPVSTPVQETVLSWFTTQVGTAGGVLSTVKLVGPEVIPCGSVWVTFNIVPFGGVVVGVHDQVPFDWTTTGAGLQVTGLPALSLISIVAPGSPKPEIGVVDPGLTTGAAGAVINSLETVVVTGVEGLRLGRLAVATTVVPGVNGAVSSQTYCPFPAATTGEFEQAIGLLEPSTKVIVAPGWAVPVMTWSALLTGLIVGVWVWLGTAGGVGLTALESATVVCAGPLWLPAGSIALAVTTLPWASGEAKLQV
jgi:hypothetical protein